MTTVFVVTIDIYDEMRTEVKSIHRTRAGADRAIAAYVAADESDGADCYDVHEMTIDD